MRCDCDRCGGRQAGNESERINRTIDKFVKKTTSIKLDFRLAETRGGMVYIEGVLAID